MYTSKAKIFEIYNVKVYEVSDAPIHCDHKLNFLNMVFRKTFISYQDGVEIENGNRAPLNKLNFMFFEVLI